jgi:uncharacterized membrane protein
VQLRFSEKAMNAMMDKMKGGSQSKSKKVREARDFDDDFIKEVRDKVTEGSSALFLLTGKVTLDKVEDALKGESAELIRSNLSNEQEAKLREHFSVA